MRALVYPADPARAAPRNGTRRKGRRGRREEAPAGSAPATLPTDDYLAKLVKYIPAEVIAFFTPIAAFLGSDEGPIAAVAIAGAIGTLIWIYANSARVPVQQAARWYTYLIGLLAYLAWALGISRGARDLVNISDDWSGVILAIAVFLLPGVDLAFSSRRRAA